MLKDLSEVIAEPEVIEKCKITNNSSRLIKVDFN